MMLDPCGCGCCAAPTPAAPIATSNPPGLANVSYRIGTYPSFREALIEQLGDSTALRALSTRDPSDYALTLLDSWAYLADILTFYSERTINEAFLRTARLRESVVRLAAMVGYDPSPGLAATVPLAFTAQGSASFALAAGARVQSAPAAGEAGPPVKFETLAAVTLSAALNAVPLLPAPQPATPLTAGSNAGRFEPGAPLPADLAPGTILIAWSPELGEVERKRLLSTDTQAPAGGISWTPALEREATRLSVAGKSLRLFGYDAPPSFIGSSFDAASGTVELKQLQAGPTEGELGGEKIPYDYELPSTDELDLDAVYSDLEVGDRILIPIAQAPTPATACVAITEISTSHVRFGPLQATVSRIKLEAPIPAIPDRRAIELIILGDDVQLWSMELPATIDGTTVLARMPQADAPMRGQAVVLADATGVAYEATVVSSAAAHEIPETVAISVSPAPAGPLLASSAQLLGNVVRASQGETLAGELLGSGDATIAGQRLALGKPPITYTPAPGAPHGGQSTLVVRVAGVQWSERQNLYGAGPGDRVFVVEREDDGACFVRFGDGVLGARLPSGAQVTAEYRTGLGSAGNVAAGALRLPLTRPTGLVSVFNPIAAGGGADPETLEQARANAPNTMRTFERIVSLQDVEDQARANALVAKASASWITVGAELGVGLTVAGPDGAVLGPEQMSELRADLDARRDPNRTLQIASYAPLALSVGVRVIALEADLRSEEVETGVAAALLAHFAFDARQFGQPVLLSEVFVAAQNTPGVIGVDVEELTLADPVERSSHQLSAAPVQGRIDLAPNELATLAEVDLRVSAP
jgi:hypothetical protein